MDRTCLPAAAARNTGLARVRHSGIVRLSRPGGPIRELETAAGSCDDRAHVPSRVGDRPAGARVADRCPGPDWLCSAGGPSGQEWDPACGVRAAARRTWL